MTLEYFRLDIGEPALQRPVKRRPCQVDLHIWFAQEFVHTICDGVEFAGAELRVLEAAAGEDIDAPFDCGQAYDCPLKILLDEVDRRLEGQVEVGDDECEFELFLEVFELLAQRVTDVEALREHPAYVHVMPPNQVLHVVSKANFRRDCSLSKDVIDLLVRSE